jgi:lipopolysaccharide biosynthesis protein
MLLIVFVHFNPKNFFDEYVEYYIDKLLNIREPKEFVFVSTSAIEKKVAENLKSKGIEVIQRENIGYDFYSYKLAIESKDMDRFSSVLICNDSVFGPFNDINTVYNSMQNSNHDIVGLTKNEEHNFHLQSYFILFKQSVIHSQNFKSFWNNVEIISDRSKVIEMYELGLSKFFIKHNFKLGAYCHLTPNCSNLILHSEKKFKMLRKCLKYFFKGRLSRVQEINVTHLLWRYLITNYNYPFLKRELIDKNPERLDISKIPDEIEKLTNYPKKLFLRK